MTLETFKNRLKKQNIYITCQGNKAIFISNREPTPFDDCTVTGLKMSKQGVLCIEVKEDGKA